MAERRNLARDESNSFWGWAAVEVLRMTGVRIEELSEISHHSLVQYQLPNTGELVPLLQIAPSKTDEERLLVVSPELADVLSAIICRIRTTDGSVPLVIAYDHYEKVWNPAMPLLFQRKIGLEDRPIPIDGIRTLLQDALAATGFTDATGKPLHFAPHDFRRIFTTDAVMSGMPPHIAQLVLGHRDINTTMGYKAVYPRKPSTGTGRSSPAAGDCGPARSTAARASRSGKNSSATSNAARSRSETAGEPTAPPASTSTAASDVLSCEPTRSNGRGWWTSATTSSPASSKPNVKARAAKPRGSRSAWQRRTPSSHSSTTFSPAARQPSTWCMPTFADIATGTTTAATDPRQF
ncbi:tyrosine-type recombinase/integrase [Streptomyces avermitilis]|uniref:tyrosine-type recombinase/integrase n=1 Tax=Streptomyces avermitilis TaxID=33903 RepID=UPI00381BAD23